MQSDAIRQQLQEQLRKAIERRRRASVRFDEAMQLPSGIPYPDSTHEIQLASREYTAAIRDVVKAARAVSDFLADGTLPQDE